MSRLPRISPFYQIEFNAVASGKTIAMSKRHIRWRFGFPSLDALHAGKTGVECRGVEHEVTVVWSVTSGKRRIMADNQEIHTSVMRSGTFQYSWEINSGGESHEVKIICQSTTGNVGANNSIGLRQYDLFVDGASYFSQPKVFELGIKGMSGGGGGGGGGGGYAPQSRRGYPGQDRGGYARDRDHIRQQGPPAAVTPTSPAQEAEDLRRAIAQSLNESRNHLQRQNSTHTEPPPSQSAPTPPAPAPEPAPLLDLLDMSSPAPAPSQQPNPYAPQPQSQAPPVYHHPPAALVPYRQQAVGAFGETASLPPIGFGQQGQQQSSIDQKSFSQISSQIMKTYSQSSDPRPASGPTGPPAQINVNPQQQQQQQQQQQMYAQMHQQQLNQQQQQFNPQPSVGGGLPPLPMQQQQQQPQQGQQGYHASQQMVGGGMQQQSSYRM